MSDSFCREPFHPQARLLHWIKGYAVIELSWVKALGVDVFVVLGRKRGEPDFRVIARTRGCSHRMCVKDPDALEWALDCGDGSGSRGVSVFPAVLYA